MTHVVIVDTETTGLQMDDEPISIGLIACEVDPGTGRPCGEISNYHGLRSPSKAIHPAASRMHGHSAESLAGLDFDHTVVRQLLSQADVLIAHNAAFDARMLRGLYPEVISKPWRCTFRQWPWKSSTNSRKLSDAASIIGIEHSNAHRALDDAMTLWKCLQAPTGKTDRSRVYLHKLLSKPDFELEIYLRDVEKRAARKFETRNSDALHDSTSDLINAWRSLGTITRWALILVGAVLLFRCTL